MIDKANHSVENKTQKFERTKELREARNHFEEIKPGNLIGELEKQLTDLQEESKS